MRRHLRGSPRPVGTCQLKMKDVAPRYFTMRGRRVPRRWGWDCHGLPVEYEVEKELGLSGRGDIVAMGLAPFTEACRSLVLRYADEWERVVTRDFRPVCQREGPSHVAVASRPR